MLSQLKLLGIYQRELSKNHGCAGAALEAVAEAAVKDAVGGEPVAWLHNLENFQEPRMRPLDENEISRGWTQKPLYTRPQASAAVPDLSACFITAESGGEEYKVVLRFQTLAKMQDAHSAMVHWLAASQPETKS